jgi:CO/xanthine dehydrogenase Mo-binding subunit
MIRKPEITRRGFVKAGGALFVSLSALSAETESKKLPSAAWIEINSNNSILVRTGRTEIGTGMSASYIQTSPKN